jgi:hypothetical protein|nr:MAG TPA: hypothetical protein [Caudoviricetes sp.]
MKETADIFKVTKREICLFIISAIIIVTFLGYLEQREKATVNAVLSGEVMLTSNQSKDTLSCTCKEYKKAYICSCRNTDIGVILEDDPNHLSVEDTEKALADYHQRKQDDSDAAFILNQHFLDGAASMTR